MGREALQGGSGHRWHVVKDATGVENFNSVEYRIAANSAR